MKKKTKNMTAFWWIFFLLMAFPLSGVLAISMESQTPPIEVWDQIVHNKGNIAVTVDNYGLIGGYWGISGRPSGEWPRNSGHEYIGEIKFWMGAVTSSGDTVVANTADDFQPIPSLVSGDQTFDIRVSTDTTTYEYDVTDTVGLGYGNPAFGWRVWNSDSAAWVYNQNYSSIDEEYFSGGPTSLQQSFYRFDDGLNPNGLGIEVSQTIYQWNYCYNDDILFCVMEITNSSEEDYSDFAFALYCDFDIGGPDGSGENGRLGDLVAFDQSENLAWTYDEDGFDLGWGASVTTGVMGTKYLETPDGIGMTAFRTGQWEDVYQAPDGAKFELIDSEQYDTSLPPTDQYYLQCTRGIDLTAGKTVRVVFAIVAGKDEGDFKDNAAIAQTLYDENFVGPQPPAPPVLSVTAGDEKVYLNWGDTSEVDIDPLSGDTDFRGYKIYRSDNRGYTWGKIDYDIDNYYDCLGFDSPRIAMFTVENAGDPIPHSFIDTTVINGTEYWYCIVAFDKGDTTVPVAPLQNGFGSPYVDDHVGLVIPRSDPAGAYDAYSTLDHVYTGNSLPSDGTVYPIRFSEHLVQGDEYKVIFTENDYQTYWHLIDVTNSDTVLVDQTLQSPTADPGLFPIGDGIRIVVRNGDHEPRGMNQTQFGVANDTTLVMYDFLGDLDYVFGLPVGGDKHFRSNYEMRFTATGQTGFLMFDHSSPIPLPFEVWNTTFNQQVNVEIYDWDADLVWNPEVGDYISIVNTPYDGNPHPEAFPYNHVWFYAMDPSHTVFNEGDVYTIQGAPLNGADDEFVFKVDGVNSAQASRELDQIKVYPDPYIGRMVQEYSQFDRHLNFINLPDNCTVRVYTLSGDLVKTHKHQDTGGSYTWNMLSDAGLSIASGIYLYHVESQYGDRIGRFAVIK